MKSGGNCAPIDRQRSWSHSWMSESAGQGRGGEQREAERGDPVAAVGLFKNDSLHTHTYTGTAPSFCFLRMHSFSPLYTALFGPMCVWEVRTSVTAHWERVTVFYIYHETHRVMERRGRRSEKFWALKALRSRAGERGTLELKRWTKLRGVDSCQF